MSLKILNLFIPRTVPYINIMPDSSLETKRNPWSGLLKRCPLIFLSLAWGVWTLAGMYLLTAHLNITHIDAAGHIASATSVSRGMYHTFNDSFFGGLIQGLFYPPLEDFILGFLIKILGSPIFAYQLYLPALWGISNLLLYRLCLKLSDRKMTPFFFSIIACMLFQAIEKPELVFFQGLSLIDLWMTGLSSEQLGFCFLVLLIGEFSAKKENFVRSSLWLSLCVLSHIVIGLVATALWLIVWILREDRVKRARGTLGAMAITAFYWLPMLTNSDQLVKITVFTETSMLPFLVLATVILVLGLFFNRTKIELALATLLLFAIETASRLTWEASFLSIPFHYYRLQAPAVFLLIFATTSTLVWIVQKKPNLRKGMTFIAAALLTSSALIFTIQKYDLKQPFLNRSIISKEDFSAFSSALPAENRVLAMGEYRSNDFAMDSVISSLDPDAHFVKGLFWEANDRNALLNSYLISLMSPPGVLVSAFYDTDNCIELRCMWGQFFNDFAITHVSTPALERINYMSYHKKACFSDLLKGLKKTDFTFNQKTHSLYELPVRTTTSLRPYSVTGEKWYDNYFLSVVGTCTRRENTAVSAIKPEIQKVSNQEYRLNTHSQTDTLFSIPYNFVPGMKLFSEEGNEVAFDTIHPILTAKGKGTLKLTIKKTFVIQFAEYLSGLSLFAIALGLLVNKRKSRPAV